MVVEKILIIDGENHLLGRLASVIAKQLLLGKKIVVVRCEGIVMSGRYKRMEYKYKMYLRKRVNTNPRKGPFHFRSPAKMLVKAVRGMLPSRTDRGKIALTRLATFVGVPPKFATKKRMTIPSASRVLTLNPNCPFNRLERLAKNFGWKYADVTSRLEAKRKEKGVAYYEKKKQLNKDIVKAKEMLGQRLVNVESQLKELGFYA
ncbi:60S ribosomal protein L13a [Thelohanellus kitauei]|uniref:Large ribosomal subunit protein uL13 n=1 Tax=Thelohanellus kitauei TaxID=669202 RepID=A0A0C2JQ33_THEKT|nr:60S ribosomal protein L13a [Thelohanellus kitauei]